MLGSKKWGGRFPKVAVWKKSTSERCLRSLADFSPTFTLLLASSHSSSRYPSGWILLVEFKHKMSSLFATTAPVPVPFQETAPFTQFKRPLQPAPKRKLASLSKPEGDQNRPQQPAPAPHIHVRAKTETNLFAVSQPSSFFADPTSPVIKPPQAKKQRLSPDQVPRLAVKSCMSLSVDLSTAFATQLRINESEPFEVPKPSLLSRSGVFPSGSFSGSLPRKRLQEQEHQMARLSKF